MEDGIYAEHLDGVLLVRIVGAVQEDVIARYPERLRETLSACVRHRCKGILFDLRAASLDINMPDTPDSGTAIAKALPPGVRVAALRRTDDLKKDAFFRAVAEDHGVVYRPFDDEGEALAWLRGGSPMVRVNDIGTVADELTEFVSAAQPAISGPSDIKYGIRWEPTISYWSGTRRVHLWLKGDPDAAAEGAGKALVVEIADIGADGNRTVQRCHVSSVEEARSIMRRFLCERCGISQFAGHEWIRDHLQHDKFIPDPPDAPETSGRARPGYGYTAPSDGSFSNQINLSGDAEDLELFVQQVLLALFLPF